jgi:leucyl aminopeptidase
MDFRIISGNIVHASGDLLLVPVFEGEEVGALDGALGGMLSRAATQEGFRGRAEQTLVFHAHKKLKAERVVLLGLGSRARYEPEVLRLAAGRGARAAAKLHAAQAVFALPKTDDVTQAVRAAVEGIELGVYRFDRYRTTQPEERTGPRLKEVKLLLPAGSPAPATLEGVVDLGTRMAAAANWARDMVNEPAGVMTPARLASEARSLQRSGLAVSVAGRREIQKLRMGLYLGVAQGSVLEPQLIHVRYAPKRPADARQRPVVLVGKAITFDSGGLSLKTAEGMIDMKTDMAGSAAVLGAMKVIGHLKPPFPVHALIGACENMPSGAAYRPGDVLISRLGKTVEVTNTDAEGRLVLGDMLSYAAEMRPQLVVDIATLTGACMIALGHYIAGVFGEDEAAVTDVLDAARAAGESAWRLPVSDLQRDALRSEIADMKNTGERWGGAINAALFLREFAGGVPWVHLDIAGPSQSPKERGYFIKGATGAGVRTLVELVQRRAMDGRPAKRSA